MATVLASIRSEALIRRYSEGMKRAHGPLQIIHGCDFSEWVRKRVPRLVRPLSSGYSIGIGDDQRLLAAAVFTDYTGRAMQCTLASDTPAWCSRRTLRALFAYPFNDCSCVRLTVLVASDNARSLSLSGRLGFKVEGRMREHFDEGVDLMVLGMLRHECKWL